jgi:DNA-binding NarL/FixJ family response regulator
VPAWTRRVLVVEDEPLLATLLADALTQAGFAVETAGDVREARELIAAFDPDVAMLDISLGDGPTGLDLAYVVHQERPDIGVLFLTQHPDPRTAGVDSEALPPNCGYVSKSKISDTGYLIAALEAVLADDPAAYRTDLAADGPLALLNRAQLDVLRMVALGMTNAAIARYRNTTERTVERHLAAVCATLGIAPSPDVNQRVEAVRRYVAAAGLPTFRPPR